MMSLPRVTTALREAHSQLSQKDRVRDLAYLLDVDPSGSDALVLYVKLGAGVVVPASEKRAIEGVLRQKLQAVADYPVFFRWFSEDEVSNRSALTKSGLLDNPLSALH